MIQTHNLIGLYIRQSYRLTSTGLKGITKYRKKYTHYIQAGFSFLVSLFSLGSTLSHHNFKSTGGGGSDANAQSDWLIYLSIKHGSRALV